jgi:polyhydroxybutyrate depolymerase
MIVRMDAAPRAVLVAWTFAVIACAPPPRGAGSPPSPGCRPGEVVAADGAPGAQDGRRYLLDAPGGAADRPRPVILAFHGFRSGPEALRAASGLPQLAREETVIVVYPEGSADVELLGVRGRGWDLRPAQTRDRDFVAALLDRLEAERCVDRRRVYATGMSNGGFLASLLGCQLAERLAAVAPVAGALALGGCTPARPMPVLLLFGRGDTVVRPEVVRSAAAWWAARNRCGPASVGEDGCTRWSACAADVVACEGPQGHRWPAGAAATIWRFLRAHARAG